MAGDIKLSQDNSLIYTPNIVNGDLEIITSLLSAIYMSILCKNRSTAGLFDNPFYREGDFVNEFYGNYEVGSLFWYYSQQKNTEQNAQLMENAILEGLQWLIDDKLASDITTNTSRSGNNLTINIQLTNTKTGIKENYQFTETI